MYEECGRGGTTLEGEKRSARELECHCQCQWQWSPMIILFGSGAHGMKTENRDLNGVMMMHHRRPHPSLSFIILFFPARIKTAASCTRRHSHSLRFSREKPSFRCQHKIQCAALSPTWAPSSVRAPLIFPLFPTAFTATSWATHQLRTRVGAVCTRLQFWLSARVGAWCVFQ